MFYVGQEVECIDDGLTRGKTHWDKGIDVPKKYRRYTVSRANYRYVDVSEYDGESPYDLVDILELKNKNGYRASRFRPIQKKKYDISIFTAMLKDVKDKELV